MTNYTTLRRRRLERGMKQRELADLCGVTGAAVHFWETAAARPRRRSCALLEGIFAAPVDELLALETTNGDDSKKSPPRVTRPPSAAPEGDGDE